MEPNLPTEVTLRPALPEDDRLLLDIYSATRVEEIDRAGWDESQRQLFLKMQFDAQQHHYRTHYPQGERSVILIKEKAGGYLYTARSGDEIRILDIAMLPAARNRGAGTMIIKRLMDEASRSGRPVRVYVESFNPALRLFERLGFSQAGQSGFHLLMQWQPAS